MATYTIYADTTDGTLKSVSTNPLNAYNGTSITAQGGTTNVAGVVVNSAGYNVYETFLSFPTDVLPDNEEIVDVQFVYSNTAISAPLERFSIEAYAYDWGTTLTSADWRTPAQLRGFGTRPIQILVNKGNTPAQFTSSNSDLFMTKISKTGPTRLVVVTNHITNNNTLGTGNHYVRSNGAESTGTNRPHLIVRTKPLTALHAVDYASVQLENGITASIRSNGAATPTLTLGYQVPGGSWTSIGTVQTSTAVNSAAFEILDNESSIGLVASPNGDLYLIGKMAGSPDTIRAQKYTRTGTTTWTTVTKGVISVLPTSTGSINGIDATWIDGAQPHILVVGSRVNGWFSDFTSSNETVFYATLNVNSITAGSASFVMSSGTNPTWSAVYNKQLFNLFNQPAIAHVYPGSTAIGSLINGRVRVFSDSNGVVSTTGTSEPVKADPMNGLTGKSRVIGGVSANQFAVVSPETISGVAGLRVAFYNLNAVQLGYGFIPATFAAGGAFLDNWDAYYEKVDGVIRVHYAASSTANSVGVIDVSPVTYNLGAETIWSTQGAAITTIREVHNAPVDERRVLVETANTGSTVPTNNFDALADYAPQASTLTPSDNFDSTNAHVFQWAFSDLNSADTQTAFQLNVELVSSGSVVFDTGKVTSSVPLYTMAANALSNNQNYRWRVRTYDYFGNVGAWSAYNTFSTTSAGTVTITSPSSDTQAIDTSFYTVAWNYTQGAGATQTKYQVRFISQVDGSVLIDSGVVTSASNFYYASPIPSNIPYQIQVQVTNSSGVLSPIATRLFTTYYLNPMTPTITPVQSASAIAVTVMNPDPTGSEPDADHNDVYKRKVTVAGNAPFVRVGQAGVSGTYLDYAVASGAHYEYYVNAVSTTGTLTASTSVVATAPSLDGVWVFDPTEPDNTIQQYPYGFVGRAESIAVQATGIQYVGRTYPVYEVGKFETMTVDLKATIPYSPTTEDDVQWFRDAVRNRRTLCYRDNRSRLVYVFLTSISITDEKFGATVSSTGQVVDYDESI